MRRRAFGLVGMVTLIAAAGFLRAPSVLAATSGGPTLTLSPSVVAPGQSLKIVLSMPSIPANFPLPNCAAVDLVSAVAGHQGAERTLAMVTIGAPGDITTVATIPAGAAPGTYTLEARACGITWATASFQVTMAMPTSGAGLDGGRVGIAALLMIGGTLLAATSYWRRKVQPSRT